MPLQEYLATQLCIKYSCIFKVHIVCLYYILFYVKDLKQ